MGEIVLTLSGRKTLYTVVQFLNFISLITSFSLAIYGIYVSNFIPDHEKLVNRFDALYIPVSFSYLSAFHCLLNFLAFKVWSDVTSDSFSVRQKITEWILVTLLFHCCIAVCLLVISVGVLIRLGTKPSTAKNIRDSLTSYIHEVELKRTVDRLQRNFECCGADDYRDWFISSWLSSRFLKDDPLTRSTLQKGDTIQKLKSDNVPFSCCDPSSPRPCLQNHVLDDGRHFNYKYKSDLTLFKVGCAERLDSFFTKMQITVATTTFFLAVLQVITIVLIRLISTSHKSAKGMDQPGEAYLFKRGNSNKSSKEEFNSNTENT